MPPRHPVEGAAPLPLASTAGRGMGAAPYVLGGHLNRNQSKTPDNVLPLNMYFNVFSTSVPTSRVKKVEMLATVCVPNKFLVAI